MKSDHLGEDFGFDTMCHSLNMEIFFHIVEYLFIELLNFLHFKINIFS